MDPSFVSQLFPDGNVPALEAVARFAHHRQTAIANNLANIETPHYLRQDVDGRVFGRMLRQAIADRGERHPGQWRLEPSLAFRVGQRRLPEPRSPVGKPFPEAAGGGPARHDANTVVPEAELAALQRNTLALRVAQRLMGHAVKASYRAARFKAT